MLVLLDKARDQWSSSFPPVRDREEIDWRQRKWLLWTAFKDSAEGKTAFDRQKCKIQRMIASAISPQRPLRDGHRDVVGGERDLREAHGSDDQEEHHSMKMFRIKSDLKSYGYKVKDINMRQMMLDSISDQYEYEQPRGALKYGLSAEMTQDGLRALIEQAAVVANGSSKEAAQVLAISNKVSKMGARIISTADCTAIIDDAAGPGAAATRRGNTGTNTGTQRRQQLSNYTSRVGEICVNRRGVVEDEQGVVAGVAMRDRHGGVSTQVPKMHLTGDRSLFVHLEDIHPESISVNVVGVAATTLTRASGIGRVKVIAQVDDTEAEVFLDDVLYMEGASHGLFSMHLAITNQKLEILYDRAASRSSAYKNGKQLFEAKRQTDAPRRPGVTRVIVNYTIAVDHGGSWTRAPHDDHKPAAQDV
ncbi:uncharacterized protein PHALS_13396 [Plasmopara halstedii]|uniref:Uncharacterized protein n=1 Tax=Plasmopara halstedii TaxID=4781 RepID=A0A0P1APG6_PLAHL|nr:uncharacterized protein PHALS_13396 [Plasmopara halstedii]CEG43182.1 hypothetical protein PHALS_13396 [Plasmopara halstedii]|eukprot:XP_024579551.1 hypothetical protein PHALS_13396 [Plasmopara halstedii]